MFNFFARMELEVERNVEARAVELLRVLGSEQLRLSEPVEAAYEAILASQATIGAEHPGRADGGQHAIRFLHVWASDAESLLIDRFAHPSRPIWMLVQRAPQP